MSGSNERVLGLVEWRACLWAIFMGGLCAAGLVAFSVTVAAQVAPKEVQTKQADMESVEGLVGVSSEVSRLKELATSGGSVGGHVDRWEILWLHQHISERIMAASLQVDATIAQIDNEIATADEVHGYLSDRRDRTVNRANLFGILLGGGLSATSSVLQLSTNLDTASSVLDIAGGSASVGFALIGIHAQKGGSAPFDFNSNMLAEFFDRPMLPTSQYPATVWAFLNEPSPTSPEHLTRKAQLLKTWVVVQRLGSLSNTDKIARVTSEPSEMLKLSIDDLEDRAAMLQDVRARISFLKRDLGNLLASLPEVDESAFVPAGEKP
jgi:hypothetical protein